MKYKVGDKVKIKSKEWYDENKGVDGIISFSTNSFVSQMAKYLGREVTIDKVFNISYSIKEDKGMWSWTDDMFEDEIVNQKTMEKKFKCKDEVLFAFKGEYSPIWTYGIVSHETVRFIILCGNIKLDKEQYKIIPFIGNEDLVGREGAAKEEEVILEKRELVYGFDEIAELEKVDLILGKFRGLADSSLLVNDCSFTRCIPFSKFNPNDIESTKKEILMVKNGKLVKANV